MLNLFVLVFCAIMKNLGSLVSCRNFALFGSWFCIIPCVMFCPILEWDKSLSICVFIYLLLFGFCLVHLLNLWSFMCWIGSLIQFGHRLSCHTLVCAILVYLVFLFKLYLLFGSWKLYACIFTICLYHGMLAFFDPIYRGNSTKSHRLSCAWNSISYQYAHI